MPDASSKSSTSERACDACRIRKLKCPALLAHKTTGQACARCVKTGLICTYEAPPRKRGPASGKRLSALRENQHIQHERSPSSKSSPTPSNGPAGPLPQPPVEPPEPTFLPLGMPMPLPAPEERSINVIDDFFEFGYAAFPVLDREVLLTRVDQSHQLTDLDFQCLIRALAAFNEACKLRSDPGRGEGRLLNLVASVQQTRSRYDFSEAPTLDTVAASLFLFVAYNVMGRHKRAFLFLTEAIGLLDSLEPPRDDGERIRLTRIEYVVFVTENASVSIYGNTNKRKLARRPGHFVQATETLLLPSHRITGGRSPEEIERLDREAVDLLVRMTQLHAAQDINELMNIGVSSPTQPSPGHVFSQDERPYLTQFADVAITRQWMLATKLPLLFNSCQNNPLAITGLAMILQDMGASVLQWISSLPSGQLRIVGLGKVTHIARTIHSLATQLGEPRMFDNMLRDLVLAISDNDHEGNYLPLLNDCIQKFYNDVPPAIGASPPSFPPPSHQRGQAPFLSLQTSHNYLPTPQSTTRTSSDDVDIALDSPSVQEMNNAIPNWQAPTIWDGFNAQAGQPSTSGTIIEDDAQFQASLAQLLGL